MQVKHSVPKKYEMTHLTSQDFKTSHHKDYLETNEQARQLAFSFLKYDLNFCTYFNLFNILLVFEGNSMYCGGGFHMYSCNDFVILDKYFLYLYNSSHEGRFRVKQSYLRLVMPLTK